MFSAALYARVQLFLHDFAHEIAGAARIRHSLLPHLRDNDMQTSGKSCRGIVVPCPKFVVPANAGTHNHRSFLKQKASDTVSERTAAAYGSPRSRLCEKWVC